MKMLMRKSTMIATAVALSLLAGACADANRSLSPEAPHYSTDSEVKMRVAKGYCAVGQTKTDSKIIQPSAGGTIGVGGNALEVPKNAVSRPTMFIMTAKAVDCSGQGDLRVDLEALQQDEKGDWKVSVGHLGFAQPLRLKLTYGNLSDAGDPAALRVIWIRKDGTQVLLDNQVNSTSARALFVDLSHFSGYAAAWP